MTTTLRIHGWDKWQSYRKDRGTPPWIKVHRCLLTNPEWAGLSDAEKGQLVTLWLIAADKNGEIPADAIILRKVGMLDETPNINKFIELGFIVSDGSHDDATVAPTCCQDDAPEERRGEENKRANAVAFDAFWDVWPKKVDRKKAEVAWKRLPVTKQLKALEDAPRRYAQTDKQFIPHPTTYIHGERWDDEMPQNSSSLSEYAKGAI